MTTLVMKLELKKFDLRNIKDDSVVVLIGARNTGKSFCLNDILFHNQKMPVGIVISATERANHFYEKKVPGMLIHDEYSPEIIAKLLERQTNITDQQYQEVEKYGGSDVDPRCFLVLDDCLYDKSWTTDKNMRYLFMNGRHIKIFLLITMQFPLGIPPVMRGNIDYIFIMRENNISNRKRIYDHYAGMIPSYAIFEQIMDQCTEDYHMLVISKKSQSNKLEDQLFWFKAEARPNYKLCSQEFWNMQAMDQERKRLGFGNDDGDEEAYSPSSVTKKKNAPKINVKKRF